MRRSFTPALESCEPRRLMDAGGPIQPLVAPDPVFLYAPPATGDPSLGDTLTDVLIDWTYEPVAALDPLPPIPEPAPYF